MNQSQKSNETGRSMVEMLGVLTVIGVISLTGIASFNNAMNKYRANELLNEASKRAVIVSTQIAIGRTGSISLAGFTATMGGAFDSQAQYTAGAETFTIGVSGVTEGVCEQLKSMLGDNAIMAISQDCSSPALTLTFDKDLKRITTNASSNQGGQQQTPADPCAGYDAQCCNNGDITGTGTCDYNGGSGNGLCNAGTCESNPCYNSDCPSWAPCSNGECQCPSHGETPTTYNTSLRMCCAGSWGYNEYGWGKEPDCMM